jgi:hypothetical protein
MSLSAVRLVRCRRRLGAERRCCHRLADVPVDAVEAAASVQKVGDALRRAGRDGERGRAAVGREGARALAPAGQMGRRHRQRQRTGVGATEQRDDERRVVVLVL